MQHELELTDVKQRRPGIVNLVLTVKLWEDPQNPATDPPVYTEQFSQQSKTVISGLTLAQLLARVRDEMLQNAQNIIDKYKYEQQIKTKAAVISLINDVNTNLVS
ncbi:MAG: hypothetical protein AMJ75_00370 [Phycisphaerae bacterium SM1_79]|nr:MAG: hypothetical protein AMJ75_00370 [Phycisphaerae bacterium SM1_79]